MFWLGMILIMHSKHMFSKLVLYPKNWVYLDVFWVYSMPMLAILCIVNMKTPVSLQSCVMKQHSHH